MDALDRCGFRGRPVMLLIQSDEENGSSKSGHATINYICERAKDAIAFLNTEPSNDGKVVVERKGILRYDFKIHGMAQHSSICYKNAANAIAEAAYKIIELEKLKDADGLTCNCGVISGGTVANTVAEWCSFQADIRFSTYDEMKEAERIVRELSDRSFVEGCSCEVTQIGSRPPMVRDEMNELLLEKIREINSSVGLQDLKPVKENGGSDAAYTTQHGIPTLDNFGVRGGGIHSVREYVIKRSLAESAKQLAAVAWYIK